MYRTYIISHGGKARKVKSNKFCFDVVKKYYADILKGEFITENKMRFYSPKRGGYVYVSWEV